MADIQLNWYKVFCVVAKSKSYADASEKLSITPSCISTTITNLESVLDTKLFDRKSTGMTLTKQGKELYELIGTSIEIIDFSGNYMLDKTNLENGEITIGSQSHIINFYLMDIIEKASVDYPNLHIKMISNVSSMEMMDILSNHKVDFVVMGIVPNQYKEDDKFVIKPIKKSDYIFISKEPIEIDDVKDLEKYNYILSSEYTNTTKDLMKILNKNKIKINSKFECDITEVRISAVKKGLGISYVLRDSVEKELKSKELYEIKVPFELPSIDINLVYNRFRLTKVDKCFLKKYIKLKK